MLPNGEVVPIPPAERWGAGADAAAEGGGFLRDLRVGGRCGRRGGCLPARETEQAAGASWLVCTPAATRSPRLPTMCLQGAVVAAGTGLASAAVAGAHFTAAAVDRGVQLATAPLVAAPEFLASTPQLLASVPGLAAQLVPHRAPAGAASTPAGSGAATSQDAGHGELQQRPLRAHSSPDASLTPEEAARAAQAAQRPQLARASPQPVRALLRQSSNVASSVLSRLVRTSPGSARGRRRSLGSAPPAAAEEGRPPGIEASLDAALAAVAAEAEAGAAGRGRGDAAAAGGDPLEEHKRRLHEQALAELAVLAAPGSTMRPPELPSAAGAAEVAELRLQEQRALYQHRRSPSGPLPGASEAAQQGSVFCSSTAPPTVTRCMARMTADQRRQQEQQQLAQQEQQQLEQTGELKEQQWAKDDPGRPRGLDSAGVGCQACRLACAVLCCRSRYGVGRKPCTESCC